MDTKGQRCLPIAQETISREVACVIYKRYQSFHPRDAEASYSFLLILIVGVWESWGKNRKSLLHQSRVMFWDGSREIRELLLPSLNNLTSRVWRQWWYKYPQRYCQKSFNITGKCSLKQIPPVLPQSSCCWRPCHGAQKCELQGWNPIALSLATSKMHGQLYPSMAGPIF